MPPCIAWRKGGNGSRRRAWQWPTALCIGRMHQVARRNRGHGSTSQHNDSGPRDPCRLAGITITIQMQTYVGGISLIRPPAQTRTHPSTMTINTIAPLRKILLFKSLRNVIGATSSP